MPKTPASLCKTKTGSFEINLSCCYLTADSQRTPLPPLPPSLSIPISHCKLQRAVEYLQQSPPPLPPTPSPPHPRTEMQMEIYS